MKTLLTLISAFVIFSLSLCGQSSKDAPANVKSAFAQKFPNITKVEWGKENDKEWEAEFKMDGKEYSANFDNTGKWLETEYEISTKDIPAAVKTSLDKESAGYTLKESAVSETATSKAYEFVIVKDKVKKELVIDQNGKVLKNEPEKEEKEDDEKN